MNWKFWTWQTEADRYADKLLRELDVLEEQVQRCRAENKQLKALLELQRERPVAQEVAAQLTDQLVVVTEATPWWRHLHGLLALEIDQAVNDALVPDLSNDAVNVRRGRAAMLKDFRGLLNNLWLKAQLRRKVER